MNCRRFQHEIYAFLDGSLSRRAQAAAERHLAGCRACRQVLEAERLVGRVLSGHFRGAAESLQLAPEVGRRVLAALAEEPARPARATALPVGQSVVFFWRRLAWPLAAAAAGLVVLVGFFLTRTPKPQPPPSQPRLADRGIAVQFSYVVPIYTFRQEGGFVIDALTCQTNVVNERLGPQLARLE